jgi:hypothetical protein
VRGDWEAEVRGTAEAKAKAKEGDFMKDDGPEDG